MAVNRRNFIKAASMATTTYLISSIYAIAKANPANIQTAGSLDLKILATGWGFPGTVFEFCEKVKKEGYDGIEMWWPLEPKERSDLFEALKKNNLQVGFLCGCYQSNWQEHLDHFKKTVIAAATNTIQRPLYINCHSGRDFFSYDENKAFIDFTTQLNEKTGVLICHETHRSRILFAAPVAKQYLQKIPDLKITLDISHWCNVSESYLQDQAETVNLALERTEHIHARIGHPQGPQVNDPRAPEWAEAVKAHLSWWDKVVERKRKTGGRLTMLTEFGPADYMPTVPYTHQPLANQWEINVHMLRLLRERYLS